MHNERVRSFHDQNNQYFIGAKFSFDKLRFYYNRPRRVRICLSFQEKLPYFREAKGKRKGIRLR